MSSMSVTRVPEVKGTDSWAKRSFEEVIAENFTNLVKIYIYRFKTLGNL